MDEVWKSMVKREGKRKEERGRKIRNGFGACASLGGFA